MSNSENNSKQKKNNRVVIIGEDGIGKTSILAKYMDKDCSIENNMRKQTQVADCKKVSFKTKDTKDKQIELTFYDTDFIYLYFFCIIALDLSIKIEIINQLFKKAGQEKQRSFVRLFFRNTLAIIIVFDLSLQYNLRCDLMQSINQLIQNKIKSFVTDEEECLKQVEFWYTYSTNEQENLHQITPLVFFVGNKWDLLDENQKQEYYLRRKKLFQKLSQVKKIYYIETSTYNPTKNIEQLFEDVFQGVYLEFIADTRYYMESFKNKKNIFISKIEEEEEFNLYYQQQQQLRQSQISQGEVQKVNLTNSEEQSNQTKIYTSIYSQPQQSEDTQNIIGEQQSILRIMRDREESNSSQQSQHKLIQRNEVEEFNHYQQQQLRQSQISSGKEQKENLANSQLQNNQEESQDSKNITGEQEQQQQSILRIQRGREESNSSQRNQDKLIQEQLQQQEKYKKFHEQSEGNSQKIVILKKQKNKNENISSKCC